MKVKELTPAIGAEIHDVDLGTELSDDFIKQIRDTFRKHKVIFFRDQDISSEEHVAFASRFGELEVHPFFPSKEGYPEVLVLTHNKENKGSENIWHSDVSWREVPSLGSILRAKKIPDVGGDTLFSNMELAYEELDSDLKEKLQGLTAIHDAVGFRNRMKSHGASDDEVQAMKEKYPEVEHPVIRTHPETGKKSLYVNKPFTQRIVGMSEDESRELLDYLFSLAAKPEYQCRFRWQANSIAFWDNRACQHYAVSDYWPAERIVERVTIIGSVPV